MANLPPVPVMGSEGPPPIKKPRTDSDSDVFNLLDNFNAELPEDLISDDLLNSTDTNFAPQQQQQQQVSTPPQQQQQQQQLSQPQQNAQASTSNTNTLNQQRPPLSSPQPPSSISTSGDPTPTMPNVSSTPAHNVASSAGINLRTSNPMSQMPNHSVPSSYNSMGTGSPHHMAPMQGHMVPSHMQHRARPPMAHGGIGPMRVGMPNQHAMMMSPQSHGGMAPRPGMGGMGGMVSHQPVAHGMGGMGGMRQVQMAGGPQYMQQHPATAHHGMHHSMGGGGPHHMGMPNPQHHGMHPSMGGGGGGPHHMVNPGMPNQQHMGGMGHMQLPGGSGGGGGVRPNLLQSMPPQASQPTPQQQQQQNPQSGMNHPMNRPIGGDSGINSPAMGGGGGATDGNRAPPSQSQQQQQQSLPPQHNDIGASGGAAVGGGGNSGGFGMSPSQQQQQQRPPSQQSVSGPGQGVSTGPASAMPGTPQSSGPGSNSSTPNSQQQQQQSNPSTTPPIGGGSSGPGSGLPGITPTLDTQPQTPQQQQQQHNLPPNTPGSQQQISQSPNSMTTPPNQTMQNTQADASRNQLGRVPTPPPPGGAGSINSGGGPGVSSGSGPGGLGGFPSVSGGNPQQQTHPQQQQQQPPGTTSDPEKRKQIQQQLVLLLHAHKCQRREQEQQVSGDYTPCSLPHCKTMKNVLNHMTGCQAGRNCQYPHCASSRQIITHWKNCHRSDCPVCLPLKQTSLQHKRGTGPDPSNQQRGPGGMMGGPGVISNNPGGSQPSVGMGPMPGSMNMGGGPRFNMSNNPSGFSNNQMMNPSGPMGGGSSRPMMPPGQSYPPSGMPASMAQPTYPLPIPHISSNPTQPWHDLVNPDLRQHLVRKLVEAIYPVHDPVALQDKRVFSLIQYAMKVEKAMFDSASNREDYYKLLAQKIYHIRKELEDRKKIKKGGHQVNGGDPSIPPSSGINNFMSPGQQQGGMGQLGVGGAQQQQGQQQGGGQGLGPAMSSGPPGSNNFNLPSSGSFSSGNSGASTNSNAAGGGGTAPPPGGVANSPLPPQPPTSEMNSSSGGVGSGSGISGISSPLPKDIKLSPPSSGYQGSSTMATDASIPNSTLPSVKEEPMSTPAPSAVPPSHLTNSPHPPSSVEMNNPVSSIPSVPSVDSKKDIFQNKTASPAGFQEPASSAEPMLTGGPVPSVPEQKPPASVGNQKIQPDPSLRKVFTADDLVPALMPVFELVWNQDPESFPFRQPVDPKALGIPDYFDIIKNPIDLSTIRNKLEDGEYKSGWEFCNDMYLMFDNAWSYNRKTSRVYRYCTKLSEVFEASIDEAMQRLGYCCGHRYTYHPQVLYCYGKPLCTIPRDAPYYGFQNRYVYCVKCFGEIQGDTITVGDDPLTATIIPKNNFKEMKNNSIDREGMVECVHCGRKMHSVCVLHLDNIWSKGFQCETCLKTLSSARKENKFTAKRLPTTKLATFLEDRVNNFIHSADVPEAGTVTIRVVSSSDKVLDTRMLMKERYSGEFPEQFPYRSKAMFVFEEIDGVDVCFFGMHVQEYGSDCQAPNTRRVYISYLDSVHFFRPRSLRTSVYHEILIGYLDFCKMNGFQTAHIWACPPSEGDDYIFHCHPDEQKIPKPKRLTDWYRKMLDRGKADNVVYDYRDIFKHCTEECITSVTDIPYFDGDFWPNVIEETIKELDQEAKQREASEKDTEGRAPKKADKRSKGSKKTGTRSKSTKKGNMVVGGDDLSTKVYQTMEKHKDVFFTVLLNPPSSISSPLPGTTDPDNLIACDLMDGRDAFLTMARERHWEFSSLRRAKYSTMAMLYELHTQGDRFVYNCNNCRLAVETRYHCKECEDFDLCVACYAEVSHPHPMEKLGLGLELENPQSHDTASQKDPKEQRKASIEKCIRFLVHATQCHDVRCKQPSCIKMKRVLTHTRECRLMLTGKWNQCTVCKQFVLLCISHAKTCKVDKCPVPVCARIKKNLRDQQNQRRVQANRFMQQRMAQMSTLSNPSTAPTAAAAAAPAATPASSQASVASPAPPSSTSPGNSTSINSPSMAKGSPATHPSNPASNSKAAQYMNVPSPATGPRSVGKGGPRTPNAVPPAKAGLMSNSPSVHSHLSPAAPPPTGKPDAGSTNLIGSPATPGMHEELTIQKVGPGGTSNDQFNMMGARVNPAAANMRMNAAMMGRRMGQPEMMQQGMHHPGMYSSHMGVSQIQSQPNPMMRMQQHVPGGNYPQQQHQAAMMRQQQGYMGNAQFRMNPQSRMMPHSPMYQNMGPQQHPSQLEQILTAPQHHQPHPQYHPQGTYMSGGGPDPHHPQYTQQPGGYMPPQMGAHPSLGPPPQYPANRPQGGGFRGMPGAPARPGGMVGGDMGGGGMYQTQQQQPQFTNNNNNNNNNSLSFNSLPPQDKLSKFVEHL